MLEYLEEINSEIVHAIFGTNVMDYWIGVLFAIVAGVLANIGTVMQKKVVNEVSDEAKFFRSLIKEPLWVLGLLMGLAFGAIFYMLAQLYIGPTLIPGLMAVGLVVLAIGAVKIVGEELKLSELIGIFLMIGAIAFIGLSGMEIKLFLINFQEIGLIIRIIIFTILLVVFSLICEIIQRKNEKYRGISLAILSGFMFTLSNFWISPCMALIGSVFTLKAEFVEYLIFISACVILILSNFVGIAKITESFRVAQASNMIPIQQIPVQVTPPFYFLIIYLLPIPDFFSILFLFTGIGLVIFSSVLLAKRQAELEEIK
ncbi:MAG: hypothetical protein ACFFCM_06360 [Promethearchaeota archaeon]